MILLNSRSIIAALALLFLPPAIATAQGVFDLGPLSGAAQQLGQELSGPAPADPQPASGLTFTVSQELRDQNQAKFIEGLRAMNEAVANDLAGHDLIGMFGEAVAKYGLKTDNVADAYTAFLIVNHSIVNKDDSESTQAQVDGTLQMVRQTMEAMPDLIDASDHDKQSMTDALFLQALLNQITFDSVKDVQPEGLQNVIDEVRRGSQEMGINLDNFEMTPDGLVARQ